MKTIRLWILMAVTIYPTVQAGDLTMAQCVDYALVNNGNVKIAGYDQAIARKKVDELLGSALPQISASGSIDDNLKVSTQLLPGALMGRPGGFIPVQMGTAYGISAGAQLDQKIFDPALGIALKAAKINDTQSTLNATKTREQTAYSVCRAYYQTLILQKQYRVLQSVLTATHESLKAAELRYDNGAAKKIDVDKIKVQYQNNLSRLQQTDLSRRQSLNNLKYYMGMPLDSSLVLADTSFNIESEKTGTTAENADYCEKRMDYRLLKVNLEFQKADRKKTQAGYLPSLSFNAQYNYKSMPDYLTFSDSWYENSSIGLRLSLPLFDGFQRHARSVQSHYAIGKAEENISLARQSIKVDVSNYEMQYRNAIDNITNERATMALAEDVYRNTRIANEQGTSSSLELIQAESSLRDAQNNYFNKLLTVYVARLDLEQSTGNLMNFIGNVQ